jgi:peptidoglycan/LPS O-acetylase OafA/YrhL
MKSTSGVHYQELDHIRGLAAFMVFAWHFLHGARGTPLPFEVNAPAYFAPLALFDEGHVGVSLFMTLSGYLFAKIIGDRQVKPLAFFLTRGLRLLPLMALVILINALLSAQWTGDALYYVKQIYWQCVNALAGFLKPIWPNGGWSIAIEIHFYLLLIPLLFLWRRSNAFFWILLIGFITFRALWFTVNGEVQSLAYYTILGRMDQFLLGMAAWRLNHFRAMKPLLWPVLIGFCVFYWWFATAGGYHKLEGYPSKSPLWIILATIEGYAFALLIANYDGALKGTRNAATWIASKAGEYSYFFYLFHYFVVFKAAAYIHQHIVPLSNLHVGLAAALVCFLAMFPFGYLSQRFFEQPFLKLRRPYLR